MNICYLIDVAPGRMNGGGQIHLLNLVRVMKSQIPASPAGRSNLKSQIYGGNRSGLLSRIVWTITVIPRIAFHHFFFRRFDLIHAHSIPAMIPAKILSLILGIPIVTTIHGTILTVSQNSYIRSHISYLKIVIEKIVLTTIHYNAQITVSRDFLQYPNVNKNIVYIPNGVNLSLFKGPSLHLQGRSFSLLTLPRRQAGINHQPLTILFVGRKTDLIKGFSILEQAITLVRKQFPSVRLLVADGSVPSARLPALYQSANLLAIPSLSEGFPLALLEAWASKLPVIATSVGEIPYLVKDGVNGFLVGPDDTLALANGIIRAFKHKNLAKIGENGYNLAKRYSWKKVATQTYSLYQQILHEPPFTNH